MNQMPEKNSQAFSRYLIFGFLLLAAVAGYFYWRYLESQKPAPIIVPEKSLTDAFTQAAEVVQKRFVLGDQEEILKTNPEACFKTLGSLNGISLSYARCNADYLECYYKGMLTGKAPEIKIQGSNRTFSFALSSYENGKIYRAISRSLSGGTFLPPFGIELELKSKDFPDYSMKFMVEDSCHDVFLPRRKFAYGEEEKIEILEWDNLDMNLFVDRFLVSNRDIKEWNEVAQIQMPFDQDALPQPSSALSLAQMKEYCAFRGKSLLRAEVADASSFLPSDREEKEPLKVKRGPYYWTKDSKQTFLFKKEKKLLNKENCSYAYVKDCVQITSFDPYFQNPSWMGMNQVLGGPLEAFDNPLEPLKNIKASSYYFDFKSSWHAISKRASWNGTGHDLRDFDFGKEAPDLIEGNLKVAFRCMGRSPFILKESDEDL